jgi:hypothetical protein
MTRAKIFTRKTIAEKLVNLNELNAFASAAQYRGRTVHAGVAPNNSVEGWIKSWFKLMRNVD